MIRLSTFALLPALALLALAPVSARAEDAAKPLTRSDVEGVIQEYLAKNPQVVIDAITNFQQKQYADQAKAEAEALGENYADLTAADMPSAGNLKGDVTVVEFFDYNCGYCKRAIKDVLSLIDDDKNVRVVFVDFPILSPDSAFAARWALAAQKQGKYFEYHKALMEHPGHIDEKILVEYAKKLGLDEQKLRKDAADDQDIQQRIEKNMDMAQKLGLHGTPAFIIGDSIAKGYIPIDGMKQAVAEVRKKASEKKK